MKRRQYREIAMRWGLALAVAATFTTVANAETTLERAKREGVIRIGYANEAPWGYRTPDGKLTGESPEVARVLFQKLGIAKVEGVLVEWGSLIPGLQSKRFDVITAAMFILPKRCAQVDFTNPTVAVGEGFLVKKGNPKNLHSYEDVGKDPTIKLSTLTGAADLTYAHDAGVKDSQILQLPDGPSQIEAVRSGRADAAAENGPSIQVLADKAGGDPERALPFYNTPKTIGYGALALRKEDKDLLAALNKEIADFIGSDAHLALVKEFGISKADLPDKAATADKLCAGQ
jgi:polar amino acid transport system substrate-binding protein